MILIRIASTRSLDRSLARLNVDRVDAFFLHCDGEDARRIDDPRIEKALLNFRDDGRARFIGASVNTPAGARAAMRYADAIMATYNDDDDRMAKAIAEAANAGKAVFLKKVLNCGRAIDPAESIRRALALNGATCALVGTLKPAHLRAAVETASGRHFGPGDR